MTSESEMELVVEAGGGVRCIYDEALDLREIGKLQITRASHVEPDAEGHWWADMGHVDGPVLGPYGSRPEALEAEREWLVGRRHLLQKSSDAERLGRSAESRSTDDPQANQPSDSGGGQGLS